MTVQSLCKWGWGVHMDMHACNYTTTINYFTTMPRRKNQRRRRRISRRPQMNNPNSSVLIRLAGQGLISSGATGVAAAFIPTDPSSSGLNNSDFVNYWQELYSEIKLVSFKVNFLPSFEETKGAVAGQPLAIASNLNNTTTPTSYALLTDNADCKIYNVLNDTSSRGYTHFFKGKNLAYTSVSSPATAGYAGCPGGIGVYGSNYTVTQGVTFYMYLGIYRVRNRD